MTNANMEMQRIAEALFYVRVPAEPGEYDIHAAVLRALEKAGLHCLHECPIAPRCRVDFLAGRIGIEIKKGRPAANALKRQLFRYLESDQLDGMVVVMQRSVALPEKIAGKPVRIVSLNQHWGVALP